MRQYLDLLDDILRHGKRKDDRTGVGTLSVFGRQSRFDLRDGFPLLTTKKLHLKSIVVELLWFLRGDTNVDFLRKHGVSIWDEWADEKGDLGPIYGRQWRDFGGVDQIAQAARLLRENPDSRRIIVSAWNPPALPAMRLAPCHCLFQFYARDGELSCQAYQRSADVFLGAPFNIASYALLTMMMAQATGLRAGELVHTLGDAHLYLNHLPQAREQLQRAPRAAPTMRINPQARDIFGFQAGDFEIENYDPHPHIRAEIAV